MVGPTAFWYYRNSCTNDRPRLYSVGPESNWYFMFVSLLSSSQLRVACKSDSKIVEPKLGKYNDEEASEDLSNDTMGKLTDVEKKGLKLAGIAVLAVSALLAWTIVPEDGVLRSAAGTVSGSPFLKSIVAFIFVFFAVPGFVYGKLPAQWKLTATLSMQCLSLCLLWACTSYLYSSLLSLLLSSSGLTSVKYSQ